MVAEYTWWAFWVVNLWGNVFLAYLGTAILFLLEMYVGQVSYVTITALMILYLITFGTVFYGMVMFLPLFLFAVIYFAIGAVRLWQSR